MNFVKDSVKLVDLAEPGRKIEYAGRVCYKSQDKITDESYIRFISNIVKSQHLSVLEHETKLFMFDEELYNNNWCNNFNEEHYFNISRENKKVFVSGNIRAWYNLLGELDDNSDLFLKGLSTYLYQDYPYIFKDFDIHPKCKYGHEAEEECENLGPHKLYTFEIVGSRSFTHQIVRHRTLSFSQESQRYTNFFSNKFNHSIRYISNVIPPNSEDLLQEIEDRYFQLIESGMKPEDARQILPNCAASTIVVSGTLDNWKKFLNLRCDTHAQREIREIAETIMHYLHLTKQDIGK